MHQLTIPLEARSDTLAMESARALGIRAEDIGVDVDRGGPAPPRGTFT